MYLKSAIVGMNNNLMPLTTKQAMLSKRYQKIINLMPLITLIEVSKIISG
jgi:hypothetical protein